MTADRSLESDRADRMLVALGHFSSRAAARAAIEAGGVTADGRRVAKASEVIARTAHIRAEAAHPYVSRGGVKLAHALDAFAIDLSGLHCLDIGASTGGFTDVLLRRGAASVTCIDVGRGQLHPKIAGDARVTAHEACDARALAAHHLRAPPALIVCDASFISLEKLLAIPLGLAAPAAALIALFKPQFEVGRDHVGKGGIVKDAPEADRAAQRLAAWLGAQGWPVFAWTPSPIEGGDGNAERLLLARRT